MSLVVAFILERLGVPFPASGEAPKTSYPADDVTLYEAVLGRFEALLVEHPEPAA